MKKIPISFPIQARRTAVIVVDMQELFCNPQGAVYVPDTAGIIQPISDCTAAARACGIPVIFLRHIVRGDGSDTGRMRDMYPTVDAMLARGTPGVEIIEALAPVRGDIIVDKLGFSGFHNTDLDTILRSRDIDTIIVCGTVTNVCCETTVRDAAHREYKVIVLADACAAMAYPDMGWGTLTAAEIQKVSLTTIAMEFGEVGSTADVISRMTAASACRLDAVA
jgi:ureidoacrylate peracid hydrolase